MRVGGGAVQDGGGEEEEVTVWVRLGWAHLPHGLGTGSFGQETMPQVQPQPEGVRV